MIFAIILLLRRLGATLDGTHSFAVALPIVIQMQGQQRSQWLLRAEDRKEAASKIEKLKGRLPGAVIKLKNASKKQ